VLWILTLACAAQVEAASLAVSQMRRELEAGEARCGELESLNRQLREASAALEAQLAASRQRVRELEVPDQATPAHLSRLAHAMRTSQECCHPKAHVLDAKLEPCHIACCCTFVPCR
jgi:chromosome segregation ATPase